MQVTVTTTENSRFSKLLDELAAGGFPVKAMPLLARGIERVGLEVVGLAVKGRFTGQGPFPVSQNKLGVVTGRLRRSIRSTKAQVNLRTGQISISFGSNVAYFAIHEFGFHGDVQVKAHTRRLAGGATYRRGKLTKGYQERLKKNLRTGGKAFAQVRQHKRKVKTPARKPLGTQLEHITTRAAFLKAMAGALTAALKIK
jgi:hypothetical protein